MNRDDLGIKDIPIGEVSLNHLIGVLLTQVDASFSDPEQRKAFKQVVRERVWLWYNDNRPGLEYEIRYFDKDGKQVEVSENGLILS